MFRIPSRFILSLPSTLLVSSICALLIGCSTLKKGPETSQVLEPPEKLLETGIRLYEDGNYRQAEFKLREALKAPFSNKSGKIQTHKYLAFIYCTSERIRLCLDEFQNALSIDPNFQLSPTEIGHPLWGPVFRSAKHEKLSGNKTNTH